MEQQLTKKYGLPTAICMVVGIVIGSGIFFKATKVLANNNGDMGRSLLTVGIDETGAFEIARRSRGTPRVANRFLKRIRDFATVLGDGIIDRDVALMGLKRMDVDALGLDELDRSMLRAIIEMYNGGPVGLETLAAALGEESVTLEDLCEPYLMQMGFLTRTPRGRCATRLAYEHLGLKAPEAAAPEDNGQQSLF